MLRLISCTTLATFVMIGPLLGQKLQTPPVPEWPPELASTLTETKDSSRSHVDRPTHALLRMIENWLSSNFELPAVEDHPRVALIPSERMEVMRYRGLVSDRRTRGTVAVAETRPRDEEHGIVAIYDDTSRTIYLPQEWTGTTPREISVLVHEMVHHLQNIAGMKFECPEAREKTAYTAQERWLGMFGLNLGDELKIDPFTILVRSTCKY